MRLAPIVPLLPLLVACNVLRGDGSIGERRAMLLEPIDSVRVGDNLHAEWLSDGGSEVVATGDRNLLDLLHIQQNGTLLTVDAWNVILVPTRPIVVEFPAPTLRRVEVHSGARLVGDGLLATDAFELSADRGGVVELSRLEAATAKVLAQGASTIALGGRTGTLNLTMTDESSFTGRDLDAEEVVVSLLTGASAEVSASTRIRGFVGDGARLVVYGHPATQGLGKEDSAEIVFR